MMFLFDKPTARYTHLNPPTARIRKKKHHLTIQTPSLASLTQICAQNPGISISAEFIAPPRESYTIRAAKPYTPPERSLIPRGIAANPPPLAKFRGGRWWERARNPLTPLPTPPRIIPPCACSAEPKSERARLESARTRGRWIDKETRRWTETKRATGRVSERASRRGGRGGGGGSLMAGSRKLCAHISAGRFMKVLFF